MQADVDEIFGGSDSAGSEPKTIDEPTVLPDSPGNAEKGANLFPQFTDKGNPGAQQHDIDMILDIPVTLMVELGRTRIPIKTILSLAQGSVIELELPVASRRSLHDSWRQQAEHPSRVDGRYEVQRSPHGPGAHDGPFGDGSLDIHPCCAGCPKRDRPERTRIVLRLYRAEVCHDLRGRDGSGTVDSLGAETQFSDVQASAPDTCGARRPSWERAW